MNKLAKRIFSVLIAVMLCVPYVSFGACGKGVGDSKTDNDKSDIQSFYDKVVESQPCLDALADDIYSYWYDAIYNNKYSGNINIAIASALSDNSENLAVVKANDNTIKSLYKVVKSSDFSAEVKAVMSSYSDYYELVVNVSGSFNSYSAEKETLKKALASALKNLQLEM